jgi:hypothetical protein
MLRKYIIEGYEVDCVPSFAILMSRQGCNVETVTKKQEEETAYSIPINPAIADQLLRLTKKICTHCIESEKDTKCKYLINESLNCIQRMLLEDGRFFEENEIT